MTKRQVIEDSDDEENAEAAPPRPLATGPLGITLSTLVSLDGSPSYGTQERNADPSTSSTELLNRESRAAHTSLIEPTPESTLPAIRTYSSSQQQTPTSPTTSRLKSKRSKTSVEKPKTKKPLKTYGKSSQDIFEFHGGSDGEIGITPLKDLGLKAGKLKENDHFKVDQAATRQGSQEEDVTRRPITSSGGDSEILSSGLKENGKSSTHENESGLQISMPPPASKSTSFDQSQQSQTDTMSMIVNPAPHKSATKNMLPPAVTKYSEIHTNERLSSPTRPLRGEVDREYPCDLTQSVDPQSMYSNEAMESLDQQPTDKLAPSSSSSEIFPCKAITVKRTNQIRKVSEELASKSNSEQFCSRHESNVSTMINPIVLLQAFTDTEGPQDQLSLSVPKTANKCPAKSAKSPKRKRGTDDELLDELGYDDNDIGVPKENYQPRPSKRRSGDAGGEILVPTDFSKRPEAIGKGKRKTKRHKTTAFQELLPKDEDEDEEVKMIPNSRFDIPEKKPPKISTETDQPDAKDDETEEIQPSAQPESNQAATTTGQKKRGRLKKVVTNYSEGIVGDKAEADHDRLGAETEEPVISAMVKKSRRHSKNRELSAPIIDEQDNNNDGAPGVEGDPKDLPANILNETQGNTTPLNMAAKPSSEKSPAKTNAVPETPHKATTPTPKGPDKHSPISSGKVAYRVGLSKRARIAPLLRIVRK